LNKILLILLYVDKCLEKTYKKVLVEKNLWDGPS